MGALDTQGMGLPPVDAAEYRNGMRLLTGAVCIVTVADRGHCAGLTATAVVSVSANPPRLLVCINRNVRAHGLAVPGARLCVNVLGAAQLEDAKRFAGMVEGIEGDDRFAAGTWKQSDHGAPELEGALASFQCRVAELIPASSHSMILCDVIGVSRNLGASPPLAYFDGRFLTVAEF